MNPWEERVVKNLKGIFDFTDWTKSTFDQKYGSENLFQRDLIEKRFDNCYVELNDPWQKFHIKKKFAIWLTKFGLAFAYAPGLIFYSENSFIRAKELDGPSAQAIPVLKAVEIHPNNEEKCVIVHFYYKNVIIGKSGYIKIYVDYEII